MNSITTLGLPVTNTSKNIRIESKKTKAQHTPYFFSAIRNDNKLIKNTNKKGVKNK